MLKAESRQAVDRFEAGEIYLLQFFLYFSIAAKPISRINTAIVDYRRA